MLTVGVECTSKRTAKVMCAVTITNLGKTEETEERNALTIVREVDLINTILEDFRTLSYNLSNEKVSKKLENEFKKNKPSS